jgi:hypothetical protein
VEQMLAYFHKAFVLDLHTYSFKRQMYGAKSATLPVFNLGTTKLDRKKHAKAVDLLLSELKKVQIKGIPVTALENDVFKGDGSVVMTLVAKFPEVTVVPLDIKKVFMDETTGEIHEETAKQIRSAVYSIAQKLL